MQAAFVGLLGPARGAIAASAAPPPPAPVLRARMLPACPCLPVPASLPDG